MGFKDGGGFDEGVEAWALVWCKEEENERNNGSQEHQNSKDLLILLVLESSLRINVQVGNQADEHNIVEEADDREQDTEEDEEVVVGLGVVEGGLAAEGVEAAVRI